MNIPVKHLSSDLVVVGGGIAGICASVAAARNGLSVTLIQDRPVLGGNASSEIRMWVCGAHGRDAKETGLIEELLLENLYLNPTLVFPLWDNAMYTFVKNEKNIRLLLNTSVNSVKTENGKIKSVTGWNLHDYTEYEVEGRFFADCSGDSILRLSGAEYRVGREASSEFGETHAPERADAKTMGNSIMIQLRRTKTHRPFIAPCWAHHFTEETFLRANYVESSLKNENFWWMEFGGVKDTVGDADEIRHELIRIALGVWEFLKNNRRSDAESWELDWVGALPGKRESARYAGDHIMIQQEVEAGGHYPDVIAHGGWSMDDHNPEAFFTSAPPTIFHPAPSPFGIPYRSLYSKNIENLFFAGRNISASHMALSSTRVMATCGTLGQAAGTAAAIAVRMGTTPRGVFEKHLELLRDTLSEQDQYMPYYMRKVPALTLNASASHEVLRNGVERMLGKDDNGAEIAPGEYAAYTFDKPETVNSFRIIFDSNLGDQKRMRNFIADPDEPPHTLPCVLAKAYAVEALVEGKWIVIGSDENNIRRLAAVKLEKPVTCSAVRLAIYSTWGADKAHVFSFEVK